MNVCVYFVQVAIVKLDLAMQTVRTNVILKNINIVFLYIFLSLKKCTFFNLKMEYNKSTPVA